MQLLLAVGAILALVLGLSAVLWLTKLILPPRPEEEAIHRGIAEARRDARRWTDRLPRF